MTEFTKNPLVKKDDKTEIGQVLFADGKTFFLPKKIIQQYPFLQSDVIFASSKLFVEYIMPIIFEDRLIGKDFDEQIELDMIVNEIKKYGIKMTINQEYDLACCSGLIGELNKISNYILRHESKPKILSKGYRQRVNDFVALWDEYIRLMKIHYPSRDYYEKLEGSLIFGYIKEGKNINALVHCNFTLDNNIFEYCKWFNVCVIEKKAGEFSAFTMKLKLDIGGSLFDGISNIVDTVSGIFSGLSDKIPDGVKNLVMDKVKQVSGLSELMKM